MTGTIDSLDQKTIILRIPAVGATRNPFDGPSASPFDGPSASPFDAAEAAANVRVEVNERMDCNGFRSMLNDPTVVGLAPPCR